MVSDSYLAPPPDRGGRIIMESVAGWPWTGWPNGRGIRKSRKNRDQQHQILLILDFINLFLVIQKSELKQLASHFGFKLSLPRLNQLLFLLEKTELITCKHSFGSQYYLPRKFKKYIDYTSKTGSASFKRETTKARVLEEILNDQPRKNAYELVIKEGGSK
jgi:hypothetical protein